MPIPAKNAAIKRQSAKMKIYFTLRDWITYGTLEPGERINDQEISDYFEVSRTPVREALQMLETQKLVVIRPNKATYVSTLEMDNLEKWYLPLAHLHALAAQLACRKIEDDAIKELRQIDSRIVAFSQREDAASTLQEDVRFHNELLAIAGNEFITEFSETLMLHIQRIEYLFFKESGTANSFASHGDLLDALEARDERRAGDEMMKNWLTTLNRSYDLMGKSN